jgi:hypothetical protein
MTKTYPAAFAAFEAANPEIAEWWTDSTFEFAVSLRDQVLRGRVLSDRQMAAALNCAAKLKAKKQSKVTREAQAVEVDVHFVVDAFAKASDTLLRPKMRLLGRHDQTFVLSMAPAHGANAGAIYVKLDNVYMGKIAEGRFMRSYECTAANEADIVDACSRPEQAAIAYGQRFGNCSICDRTLTNALSIELGIGPICRGKFF